MFTVSSLWLAHLPALCQVWRSAVLLQCNLLQHSTGENAYAEGGDTGPWIHSENGEREREREGERGVVVE